MAGLPEDHPLVKGLSEKAKESPVIDRNEFGCWLRAALKQAHLGWKAIPGSAGANRKWFTGHGPDDREVATRIIRKAFEIHRSEGIAADEFLVDYRSKHQSPKYAEYALGHVSRHLGDNLVVEITPTVVKRYQAARLREKAGPKTINDEVQLLLSLCGEQGVLVRATLRRDKALNLMLPPSPGRAYSAEEKARMLEEAQKLRTPQMYAAFALDLNTGLRDKELRQIRWSQIDLVDKKALTVGKAKTAAGTGRVIPLNETALAALVAHAAWYTRRFGECRPEWFVFAFGAPLPKDPTRPITSFKTAWTTVREKAGVKGRWHDNRHTLVTELAESGAGDEVIMSIAGHVSRAMLSRYSHVRMEAKRRALDEIATRQRTADEKRKQEIERQRLADMVPQTLVIQ
jgi:integrase